MVDRLKIFSHMTAIVCMHVFASDRTWLLQLTCVPRTKYAVLLGVLFNILTIKILIMIV